MSRNTHVVVCVGTGGVGKTTVAASLAIASAFSGKQVLVLTIDPSRRLAQTLGLDRHGGEDVRVALPKGTGHLNAGLLNSQKIFEEFIQEHAKDRERARRLVDNSLFKQLSTNLSGSQEFTALDRLYRAHSSGQYDLIVLDTPPAQNAVDFLRAPEKIYALFQRGITKWFAAEREDQTLLNRLMNKGTATALMALQKLTGAEFLRELADFFSSIQGIEDAITERSLDVHKLLVSSQARFLLVTAQDEVKLKEAKSIYHDLVRGGYTLGGVVVNRCWPDWESPGHNHSHTLLKLFEQFCRIKEYNEAHLEQVRKELEKRVPVVKIPDMNLDSVGIEGLMPMIENLERQRIELW